MVIRRFRLAVLLSFGLVIAGQAKLSAPASAEALLSVSHPARCCPCPSDAAAPSAEGTPVPAGEDESLPEVADLDTGYASASQSAAPNAIGDSIGGSLSISSAFGTVYGPAQGGYSFKASNNNNAIPQDRVYYSYQYFSSAYQVDPTIGPAVDVDLQRSVFGFEKLLIGDIYAIGVQVPVHSQLDSQLDTNTHPTARDTELGNMTVYSKHVLFQDCTSTISAGFALGLPTGDELSLTSGADTVHIENDAWTLTPYLATLFYDPCNPYYVQVFGQLDFALDDNEVYVNGTNVGDLKDVTLLRLDTSVGYWLSQDCCGNGLVAIGELHFTTSVDGDASLTSGPNTVAYGDNQQLNATLGLGILRNCWSIYPALAIPLQDSPDRSYDWEAQILFQRRLN